jgi:nucleotide-binding universal stress UspA family protein
VPTNVPSSKILVAVDGSEQSLRAIRYAAGMFSPQHTQIVLLHIQEQVLDLFLDMERYPHYNRRMTGLRMWATEQKKNITATLEDAAQHFHQKGFPDSAITIKTMAKKVSVTQDIAKESYNDYNALVVGRTGWSRLKDWLVKSTAMKLVAKLHHIPIIIVGGDPDAKNLLLAFDGTHGAMKGVAWAASLVGWSDHHLHMFSIIDGVTKFWDGQPNDYIPDTIMGPIDTGDHEIGQHLAEARDRLLEAGIAPEQISIKINAADHERGYRIVREAQESNCGSVIIGRRVFITFIDEFFVGRVSDQVLKAADQLAVWII